MRIPVRAILQILAVDIITVTLNTLLTERQRDTHRETERHTQRDTERLTLLSAGAGDC